MSLRPIDPAVLRVDEDGVTLLGGRSASTGLRHFPRAPVCPFTGADDVEPLDLPRAGTVWLHTEVTLAPPDTADRCPTGSASSSSTASRCCVWSRRLPATGSARGTRVRLDGEEVPGPDGEPVLTWVFHP